MSKLKDMQKNMIIEYALELFLNNNIESIKMSDIAKQLGIGDMTLYRYFGTKQKVVLLCAGKISNKAMEYYEDVDGNGYEKITAFYNSFLKCFIKSPSYFRFINDLDAYIKKECLTLEERKDYGDNIKQYKLMFDNLYSIGINDGSLKQLEDIDVFYYTSTHAVLSLCKKLSSQLDIVPEDLNITGSNEIKLLIEMILNYIKK